MQFRSDSIVSNKQEYNCAFNYNEQLPHQERFAYIRNARSVYTVLQIARLDCKEFCILHVDVHFGIFWWILLNIVALFVHTSCSQKIIEINLFLLQCIKLPIKVALLSTSVSVLRDVFAFARNVQKIFIPRNFLLPKRLNTRK